MSRAHSFSQSITFLALTNMLPSASSTLRAAYMAAALFSAWCSNALRSFNLR